MIEFIVHGVKVRLTFLFFAVLTLMLIIDKSGLAVWGLIAALMHETGHIIAFAVLGDKPRVISFEFSGIRLIKDGDKLNYLRNAVVLTAGSTVNLLVFLFLYLSKNTGVVAYIHLSLGLFNLLPAAPLDGGMLLQLAFNRFMNPSRARTFSKTISYIITALMISGGVYLFLRGNITLLITAIYLLITVVAD